MAHELHAGRRSHFEGRWTVRFGAHGAWGQTRLQTVLDPVEQRQLAQLRQVVEVQAERHRPAGGAAVKRQLLPSQTSSSSSSNHGATMHTA